jgi:hypothetical protein
MFRNAIDVNAYRFDASIRSSYRIRKGYENNLIIGHIGRFDKKKNHQFLITANSINS